MRLTLHIVRKEKPRQSFKALVIFWGLLFLYTTGFAQQIVRFRLTNAKQESIPYASFKIGSVPDSSFNQQKLSDSLGNVSFQLTTGSVYKVEISSVNYLPVEKTITIKEGQTNFSFTAEAASKTLGAVVVTSSRPIMRQEDDKTIVEPENLAASSTNAYEIMEKTPGLFVDQDGNIYLSSTTPATIYINGREVKMSAADIATLLKSLPPTAIASIEILRTPSARYDASGSGGIVNIVLKKGVKIGLTGSIYGGLQQGVYGNQTVGVNINNNNGQLTTYINLNYAKRNTYEQLITDRFFAADSTLNQDAFTKYAATNYYLGFGASYQFNKKWEASYDGRFSYNDFNNISNNTSIAKEISSGNQASKTVADVINKGNNFNIAQSINAKYKIDSLGSEWTIDISFTHAPSTTDQSFINTFYQPLHAAALGFGSIKPRLNYFSAQTNLVYKFPAKLTVEGGIKATHVDFDNTTEYFGEVNGIRSKDNARTTSYSYNETINSGYLQASKTLYGFTLKVGTRLENTNMNGNQIIPKDTSFTLHRTDFFPYVYFSKGLMKIAGYELRGYLVYRRTITRPVYEQLNPFLRYIDPYLSETGNPNLRPQFTHNYEANISVDERPIFAIGVNDTKDIFTQVVAPTNDPKYNVRTYDNLGSNKETYFRVLGAIPPGKRYFFVLGAQYNHNIYNGLLNNKPLSFDKASWTFFTYQTFKVTPITQLTLNGFARFNGQQQFYELGNFGALNLSLNQQFFQRKMTVTLSANDIFFTNTNAFTLNQGGINAAGYREGDTRRYGINVRYNFGIRKKEEQKQNIFNVESPDKSS
jgi:hypothetical protein